MNRTQYFRSNFCRTLACVVFFTYSMTGYSWQELDFDQSMCPEAFPKALARTRRCIGIDGQELLNRFKVLYAQFNQARILTTFDLKIPKIIHHIWLGSPLPDSLKEYVASWQAQHGNTWRYFLWTDESIAKLHLYNQDLYDATDNYGVKSDIARWEILYRFGGLYVDTDFECLDRLDYLHYVCDFYTGLQPLDTGFLQLGSALVGSIPKHPILKHCILTIKNDWHRKGVPAKAGPIHFTKSFALVAGKDGLIDVALPATYFYPLASHDQKTCDHTIWLSLGALAVHHWSKTWMPAQLRPAKFQGIDNYTSTLGWKD